MWNISIGTFELGFVVLIGLAVVFCRGAVRRWLGAVLAITILAVVLTPSDPVSALAVAVPLTAAFAIGVYAAPFLRASNDIAKQS